MNAILRRVLWFGIHPWDLYLVSEYPKSGGSWFCQMLADYLGVPFPRNALPVLGACVMHGHYLYRKRFGEMFCVVRDGRDVMVSAYYHYLFKHGRNRSEAIRYHRQRVPFGDYENVDRNVPAFIRYMFAVEGRRWNRFTWGQFLESYWTQPGVAIVRYEDLIEDAVGTVGDAVERVLDIERDEPRLKEIVARYSFEQVTGRSRGSEGKGFLRKGIAGDWMNHFSLEACVVFDELAGGWLLELGYEEDRSWIEEQAARWRDRAQGASGPTVMDGDG